ncbi:MAG: DUF87 domain-containing protein [Hyphomicrobiales bacterium]|nr:DUF87 domain-containing protein [Hyphomicrobiales bacterium]
MLHEIPEAALASHIAILGKTGAGKTFAAKGVVERLLSESQRACVIDPTGAWHGLRSSATGKSAGFPVAIFGGEHADLPLGAAHGEAIAEIIGGSSTPAILDTSLMRVGERTRFFADFADALVRKNRGPLHLVIDEAHLFMPQGKVADPQSGAMLHAGNNLVSLGRSRGLRIIMISQRPAKVHKDALTQVETLVAMRLIAPQDRHAVEDWIKDNADEKQGREIISSLATMPTGQGWVWAPEIRVLERVSFPLIKTFDTSKAPESGDRGKGPVLAPIDRDAIQKRLEIVAADAMANDPTRLKAEVARLKRELQQAKVAPAADAGAIEEVERRGFERGETAMHALAEKRLQDTTVAYLDKLLDLLAPTVSFINEENRRVKRERGYLAHPEYQPSPPAVRASGNGHARPAPAPRPVRTAAPIDPDRPLNAERRPLGVLASMHPAGMTEAQWAVGAGLKRKGGTWAAYVSRLRTAGRIEKRGDLWFATDQGLADLGGDVPAMPPPGPELVEFWAGRIPGAAPMLRYLANAYPDWMSREDLAVDLDLAASGGTFAAYLSRLRSPGLIEEDGDKNVRAAQQLMEGT